MRRSILYAIERQASEVRYRAMIEQNADGMVVVDRSGVIRYVNSAARRLLDWREGDLEGQPFGFPLEPGAKSELEFGPPNQFPAARRTAEMSIVQSVWEGEPVHLASLRDITARKIVQERIDRLNRLNASLLQPLGLEVKLHLITDGVIDLCGPKVGLVRLWVLRPGDLCDSQCVHACSDPDLPICSNRGACLHLGADAGRYRDLPDESHHRVPLTHCLVGKNRCRRGPPVAAGGYQR